MAPRPDLEQALCDIALRLPGVEQGIACKGTALECRTFLARKKTFLFVRAADARLKLRDSLPEAMRRAAQAPASCQAAASGWVKLTLGAGDRPPLDQLRRWVAESHALVAGQPAARPAPARAGGRARKTR